MFILETTNQPILTTFLQDLQNQLKKLSGEIGDREGALEQHYQALLDETTRKLQVHEVSIQRLTSTLADKEQQLQVTKPLTKLEPLV
jgi:phage host-nuclease inhibitor protein Gam